MAQESLTARPERAMPLPAEPTVEQAATSAGLGRRSRLERLAFLIPAFLFQFFWGWYPVLVALLLSLTDARPRGAITFVGLSNYTRMLNDPLTWYALRVTFTYAFMSIALTFIIPILVAILLMEIGPRWRRWMMLLWFLPLSGIASTVLWRYFYNTEYGLLQAAITALGLPPQRFLNDPNMVLFWLIFPSILLFGPGLIYMAALQGIPQSYYEAAEVEGASFWRKIWTISLPRLRPIISMMLTFAIIGTLQEFAWPQIMTNGEPGGASRTIVMYIYNLWSQTRFADSTAMAVIVFAIIMAITVLFRTLYREDPDV